MYQINEKIGVKLDLPGALLAILLKQLVKTSYKCCIGSSSLAAILINYWHEPPKIQNDTSRIVNCQFER